MMVMEGALQQMLVALLHGRITLLCFPPSACSCHCLEDAVLQEDVVDNTTYLREACGLFSSLICSLIVIKYQDSL